MIGPGWLPARPRPLQKLRRTLTYTYRSVRSGTGSRRRTTIVDAPRARSPHTDAMLFDQAPLELPVATVLPRPGLPAAVAGLRRWLHMRWRWLRPRTVPVLVAFAGMIAVLASARGLSRIAQEGFEGGGASAPALIHKADAADEAGQRRAHRCHHGRHARPAVSVDTRETATVGKPGVAHVSPPPR